MRASELRKNYERDQNKKRCRKTRKEKLQKQAIEHGFKTILAYIVCTILQRRSINENADPVLLKAEGKVQTFTYIENKYISCGRSKPMPFTDKIEIDAEGLDELRTLGYKVSPSSGFYSFFGYPYKVSYL